MKFELIPNWKQAWKLFSVQGFAIVAILPDIYNLAIAYGVLEGMAVPAEFDRLVKTIAFLGAVSRLIKQKAAEAAVQKEG